METQTTSSITLRWEVPEGPDPQGYTYWVQCTGDGGTSETRSTTNTSVSVEGLEPGTLYEFSVWAEANGVPGSNQTLNSSTSLFPRVACPLFVPLSNTSRMALPSCIVPSCYARQPRVLEQE